MEEYQTLTANSVPEEELEEIKKQLNETIRSKNIIQNVKAGDREYEGWLTDSMEKAGVIPKGNGRLYQAAMVHADELIKKDEAIIAEQEKADDIFEGFLEEDVPDAPVEEPDSTFSVLDMKIEQAEERQDEGMEVPETDDLDIE